MMDDIYLTVSETCPPSSRNALINGILGFMGFKNPEFSLLPDANGKPQMIMPDETIVGYAHSHVRGLKSTLSLIGIVRGREIGVDVEPWPAQAADPDLLKTVSCAQDSAALILLGKSGRDAAIALWVIKEAALKCTGEVMVDPCDLVVSIVSPDLFRVDSSDRASAPHPQIDVRLLEITVRQRAGAITLIVGIALAAHAHTIMKKRREIHILA